MLDLKKALAVFLTVSSSILYAGSMGSFCSVNNASVPCEDGYGSFSAEALYLQPIYDADFAYDPALVYPSFQGKIGEGFILNEYDQHKPRSGWGFQLAGAYHFDEGNDVAVNWSHFSRKTNHIFYGDFYRLPFSRVPAIGTASFEPQWNALNFESGQHVDFGDFKDIRFHAGFGFVQIKRNASTTLEDTEQVFVVNIEPVEHVAFGAANNKSTFRGFGPRIGMDMAYDFGNGFGVFANTAAALFIGRNTFNNNFAILFFNENWPLNAVAMQGKRNAFVPSVEAKLGVSYTYEMAQGDLSVALSYTAVNYFTALHSARLGLANEPILVGSDFGLGGVSVGLKWVGLA